MVLRDAAPKILCAKANSISLTQDRRPLHHPLLRPRHRKHLPLRHHHPLECALLVRSFLFAHPNPFNPFPTQHGQRTDGLQHNSISSFILIFIEIPLLLRVCPTSQHFDSFIRRFETNYMRAAIYLVMSIVQFLSIIRYATSLIAAAVVLLIAAAFYALAGLKKQEFAASKTLGGQGVAQMIV